MQETNRIEFKERLTKGVDLEKEIIAFLNSNEGGLLYFGINKEGGNVGVRDLDSDMLKIKDRIRNNIQPSVMGLFDVISEVRDSKNIIKIIVARGTEKPYFKKKYGMTEKGCYIRIGSASKPMSQKQIESLFSSQTRNSIGKIKANRQDLSFEQLRIYYEEKDKKLNNQFRKNLELITPQGDLNYAAYLLADVNNVSIKAAKYNGDTRSNLEESNEYGYVSIVKAAKSVLDKINLENHTLVQITSKERKEKRLWNPIALREAIVNAFVHNDYTREISPKIEIFNNRIEITSAGSPSEGLGKDELFEGFSVPRNKELMRVFKDLDLVEQLGSGIPRILEFYGKDCFHFSDNFLRMVFPSSKNLSILSNQEGNQEIVEESGGVFSYNQRKFQKSLSKIVASGKGLTYDERNKYRNEILRECTEIISNLKADEIKILRFTNEPKKKKEILEDCLEISNQSKNFKKHTERLFSKKLLSPTIPDKPTSKLQKYYTTEKGHICLFLLERKDLK